MLEQTCSPEAFQKASGFCLESDAEKAWRFGITSETVSPVSGNFVYVDQSMIVIYPYHPGLGMVVDSNRRRKFYPMRRKTSPFMAGI